LSSLLTQYPCRAEQTGTGKVFPDLKFKCTTAARDLRKKVELENSCFKQYFFLKIYFPGYFEKTQILFEKKTFLLKYIPLDTGHWTHAHWTHGHWTLYTGHMDTGHMDTGHWTLDTGH